MTWMIMIYLIFSAQGGIYRQQLFDLQDAEVRRPAPVVAASERQQPVATPVYQPAPVAPSSISSKRRR